MPGDGEADGGFEAGDGFPDDHERAERLRVAGQGRVGGAGCHGGGAAGGGRLGDELAEACLVSG